VAQAPGLRTARAEVETTMKTKKPNGAIEPADRILNSANQAAREDEYAHLREAYLRQPDSADEADDWSSAEEFQP